MSIDQIAEEDKELLERIGAHERLERNYELEKVVCEYTGTHLQPPTILAKKGEIFNPLLSYLARDAEQLGIKEMCWEDGEPIRIGAPPRDKLVYIHNNNGSTYMLKSSEDL